MISMACVKPIHCPWQQLKAVHILCEKNVQHMRNMTSSRKKHHWSWSLSWAHWSDELAVIHSHIMPTQGICRGVLEVRNIQSVHPEAKIWNKHFQRVNACFPSLISRLLQRWWSCWQMCELSLRWRLEVLRLCLGESKPCNTVTYKHWTVFERMQHSSNLSHQQQPRRPFASQ